MTPSRNDSPLRVNIDPEQAGAGLGRLVVVLLDVVRQLLERQALRRVDEGGLTPEQVERLGQALLALDRRFVELREIFQDSPTSGEFETADPEDRTAQGDRQSERRNDRTDLDQLLAFARTDRTS
ncbi:gas vesicle protein GvpK [Micromonospora sp. NPDC047738]|uniref:gas vesicle protein GvpK n=1 Tax=unclassified Micromonospora TaxID=2617518 RepID=UPI003400E069